MGSPKNIRRGDSNLIRGVLLPDSNNTDDVTSTRSRCSSMGDDMGMQTMEMDLFKLCKGSERDSKADAGIFLRELNKMGIMRTDPRMEPVMKALDVIRKKSISTIISGIDNLRLDFNQFKQVISGASVLICKAFKGQLVIPEFTQFCDDMDEIYNTCKDNNSGKCADYIPQLARYDPSKWGVSLCTVDGQRYSIGDVTDTFTIQSSSKPITYAICLDHLGADVVHQYIGREPSGRVFNEIVLDYNNQPHNPMVNSGAMMSSSLLLYLVHPELSLSEKYEYVHNFFKRMCGGLRVGFVNSVFLSERDTADRNFALAYYMRELNCFPKGPEGSVDIRKVLEFYFQTCSLEMNAESMSVLAATLASGGICPITGERVLKSEAVRHVLSLMHSCGMYNYSGQFSFKVGLPAKSGVSGVIIVVVPNVVGFALWSPPLDSVGNSARGVQFCEELIKQYNFHRFDSVDQSGKKDPTVNNYEQASSKIIQLLLAASNGDVTALERAYLQGFDMNMGDYDGRTALHLAAAEGHTGSVKFLLEKCSVNVNVEDRWGQTPLEESKKFGRNRVVAILNKYVKIQGVQDSNKVEKLVEERGSGERMKRLSECTDEYDENDEERKHMNNDNLYKTPQPKESIYSVLMKLKDKNAREEKQKDFKDKMSANGVNDEAENEKHIPAVVVTGSNDKGVTGNKLRSEASLNIYIDPTNPDVLDMTKSSISF